MSDLRALAEAAIREQVHPDNWRWWAENVLSTSPARDFVVAASPDRILALLDALDAARDYVTYGDRYTDVANAAGVDARDGMIAAYNALHDAVDRLP